MPPAPELPCPFRNCGRKFYNSSGRTQHVNVVHRELTPPPNVDERGEEHAFVYHRHPVLTGKPCDDHGNNLPQYSPPVPEAPKTAPGSWHPLEDRIAFDFAYHEFVVQKGSEGSTNQALDIWAAAVRKHGGEIPWENSKAMYALLDEIQHGSCSWNSLKMRWNGPLPENPPKWMTETYELCLRDSRKLLHQQLRTPDFKGKTRYVAFRQFDEQGNRVWSDLMSSDWAWKQANQIAADHPNDAPGATFIPIVAGSDKTTVSVATGHQMFHPVYMGPGSITNTARRAHGNGMLPVGFLPIPKVTSHEQKDPEFAKFARQLYHTCLALIFEPLKPGMTEPEIVRCPDGHLRRVFYGLGPYIADYPEQVYLAGIVQGWCPKCDANPKALDAKGALRRSHQKTDILMEFFDTGVLWSDFGVRCDYKPFTYHFPRADIHELLSPDLLHQVIKGTFKDHIVTWVYEYLVATEGEAAAKAKQADIDRRISVVPIYPGLRRFPEGRNFEQWTGNDSKALMKVYLACIVGYVPARMVQCLSAFLDFCYIARQNSLSTADLAKLEDALQRFHELRDVFIDAGVRDSISLPRQHSLVHYARSIRLFGSPNGLCSSITESKHIVAVKKPWRCSSRYHALCQMLRRILREEKLDAARQEFTKQGMMQFSTSVYTEMVQNGWVPEPLEDEDEEELLRDEDDLGPSVGPKVLSSIKLAKTTEPGYPTGLYDLATYIDSLATFPPAFRRFLWSINNPESERPTHTIPIDECPSFSGKIYVYHSAIAHYYAPSDLCGAGGMYHERIRSTPCWQKSFPRRDTVLVEVDEDLLGMRGMVVGRVFLFFSFKFQGQKYSCAFVHWLELHGQDPDSETGLWIVKPEFLGNQPSMAVVEVDCIARGAHLLPIFGNTPIPATLHFSQSLDVFRAFFVNRHIDHHAHQFIY
ncbi:hypothetical protein CPB83DRAFT_899922 [Crepidotus variabilis]|uniref:C2H2-type domain-containing protein n=1 Tax=Crepidotus variabilis TaxID=179855 RepID=A0A9P6JIJ3_9AGAR|nr:hypothetical protein CPB83DRAFT_899922 [Crepidotus variabilis]